MQMLYPMVAVCFILEETEKLSSKVAVPFSHSHQNRMRIPIAKPACQHLVLSLFWIFAKNPIDVLGVSRCFNLQFPNDK